VDSKKNKYMFMNHDHNIRQNNNLKNPSKVLQSSYVWKRQ